MVQTLGMLASYPACTCTHTLCCVVVWLWCAQALQATVLCKPNSGHLRNHKNAKCAIARDDVTCHACVHVCLTCMISSFATHKGCLYSMEWNDGMEQWNGMMEWNGHAYLVHFDNRYPLCLSPSTKKEQLVAVVLNETGSIWSNSLRETIELRLSESGLYQ